MRSCLEDGTVILQSEARVDGVWHDLIVRLTPGRFFSVWLGAQQIAAGDWDSESQRVCFAQGERMASQVRAFVAGMVAEECGVEYAPEPMTRGELMLNSAAWQQAHPSR